MFAAARFAAQQLSGAPARSPVEVAARLLAIQGQDPRGARLAIRARSSGLTAADVDQALTADRSLVITWLNRGTLHLVRAEDYWWLHPLTVRPPLLTAVGRRLANAGVSEAQAEQGVAAIETALTDGAQTRVQLLEVITSTGVPPDGNIPIHVIALASMRGIAVRGPMVGGQQAYVLVRDWLGAPPRRLDIESALAELARRYLAGHGPASDADLAKWAGLPIGQARRGLRSITGELRERPDGLAELAASPAAEAEPLAAPRLPPPRLLGAYDPVLHGWTSREPILGSHQGIVTVNGLFRPFALVDGKAVATWAWSAGEVRLARFDDLPADVESALAAEAQDVRRFLAAGQLPAGPAVAESGAAHPAAADSIAADPATAPAAEEEPDDLA
ncbi:MAG TPA: winged helix DNA-binding domain-containing protein [Streptosporangiaceae bacterium]